MRGKGKGSVEKKIYSGITPAYAGKSGDLFRLSQAVSGSPPPMRGKESSSRFMRASPGITPAYAGKSPVYG